MRILLVEDDDMLGEAVRDGLRQEGDIVDWVQDGGAAVAALSTSTFSALVLDLGLPRSDGLSVLRWLRQNGHITPVVIVTARDRVTDRIAGLDAGADDYLIKPFDIEELSARLRAITRRVAGRAESMLIAGEVVLDLRQRMVTYQGEPAALTAREYAVVELLMRKAGGLVTRAEIEEELYGFEDDIASNAIEVHIHNLRRKLGRTSLPTSKDAVTASATGVRGERPWSLRRRMAIAVAGAACAVFLLLGLLVYRAVAGSTAAQLDEMLQQQAVLALRYADHEYGEGESVVPGSRPATARAMPFDVVYQITTRTNELLYRSTGAPQVPLAVGDEAGYSNAVLDGRRWRVYSLSSAATPLVIHIAEPLAYRDAALSRTLRAVALPLLFALVMLTALIVVVTERAFRPVRRIASDLAERGADDLSPVNTAAMPVETHALGVALNGLLARHAEVLHASAASLLMRRMSCVRRLPH